MHTDHLGSGHKMTDSAGVVKYRTELDPYGQEVLSWAAAGDVNIKSLNQPTQHWYRWLNHEETKNTKKT